MKTTILTADAPEYKHVLEIRRTVFVQEQKVPEELEVDQHERTCVYFLTYLEAPVATGRLRETGAKIKFERIATLKEFRGKGVGKELVKTMMRFAQKNYSTLIPYMHSQLDAVPFYQKLGWITQGPIFYEANIPHQAMSLPS